MSYCKRFHFRTLILATTLCMDDVLSCLHLSDSTAVHVTAVLLDTRFPLLVTVCSICLGCLLPRFPGLFCPVAGYTDTLSPALIFRADRIPATTAASSSEVTHEGGIRLTVSPTSSKPNGRVKGPSNQGAVLAGGRAGAKCGGVRGAHSA